jgi:formamidopyrimidine-DNA glycosylase
MPELPEVETIVRGLRTPLIGRRVLRTRLTYKSLYRRGSLALRWLVGRAFSSVERVGKNAVFRFDPPGLMLVNLGMTGRLVVHARGEEPQAHQAKHLHARFYLGDGLELRYYDARRFGHLYVAKTCDFKTELNIGPDPFAASARYLTEALANRAASVKALLLDQRIVSGIGNIYADETLFHAGIHPTTAGGEVTDKGRVIIASARTILTRAIKHGGSTLRDYRKHDGSKGDFQRFHAVYGREGERCVRCGSLIRKIVLAGRGTHFCPRCQK